MPHTMLALQQDKQHNEHIADGVKSSELIRLVTKGSELQPHPGVNTLWLIPQSAYRPFTIVNYLPHCLVYYYPVADEFLPGGIGQTQMMQVAALYKALGDAQRLRLLTLVRHSAKSLGELTNTLNATKSNIHHHLTLLRTVGLVQVEDGVYSINPTNCSVIHKEPIRDFPDSDFHWCIISGLECTVGHAASLLIPDRLLGRSSSAFRLSAWVSIPLGDGLAGILGQHFGTQIYFILAGCVLFIVAVLTICVRLEQVIPSTNPNAVANGT